MSRRAIGAPIIPVPIHAISMFVTAFSAPPSERSGQVAAAVDHADDFDFRDRTIIGIRLGPVENEVRSFEQDARGGMDIRAARLHSWVINQHSRLVLDGCEEPLRRGRIIESDEFVYDEQVFARLRAPAQVWRHRLALFLAAVRRCRASRLSSPKSSGFAGPLATPSFHNRRSRLRSSCRSSRLNCQSRMASRTISLVVAYSPVSTAALSAAICSPVRATLTLWISDIFNPRAAAHSSSKHYYSFVNISRATLAAYRRHVDIGDSRCSSAVAMRAPDAAVFQAPLPRVSLYEESRIRSWDRAGGRGQRGLYALLAPYQTLRSVSRSCHARAARQSLA